MDHNTKIHSDYIDPSSPIFDKDAFSRVDENDDILFYKKDRFVSHLDSVAL